MSISITDTGNTIKWSDSVKDKDVIFNKNEVLITLKAGSVDVFEIEDSHYRENFDYKDVTVPSSSDSDDLLDQLQAFVTGNGGGANVFFPTYKKGTDNYEAWYPAGIHVNGEYSSNIESDNNIRAYPFIINETIILDGVAVDITSSGVGGSEMVLAIYTHDPVNIQPKDLLKNAGTVSIATTGNKKITGVAQTLVPGIYWATFNHGSAASPSLTSIQGSGMISLLGAPASIDTERAFIKVSSVYSSSPPDPFPTVTSTDIEENSSEQGGIIFLRFA